MYTEHCNPVLWRLLLVLCGSFTFSMCSALALSSGLLSRAAHSLKSVLPLNFALGTLALPAWGSLSPSLSATVVHQLCLGWTLSAVLRSFSQASPDNPSLRLRLFQCLVFSNMKTDISPSETGLILYPWPTWNCV